ncbi:hypothetical protein GUJ93_ZPchr0014g46615 [Zizania palustris]|uniref:Phytocyanin domain-containing protein n=1 Tax=Zizania palustris TaxID=103762 RepID=A0A8J5W6X3_ZIZPA|nr:hypothetical protein GUJ93_ZPchr0014g46615 [Zizania palustris]
MHIGASSSMARSWLALALCVVVMHGSARGAEAASYNVGDSAGWDLSADFPSWLAGKTFYVGDVLAFQYSKYHTLNEVDEAGFKNCSTASAVAELTRSDGNTTVPLMAPGDRYFVGGNELYCLGGMKLHLNVLVAQTAAPVGTPGGSPQGPTSPLAPGTGDEGGISTLDLGGSHRLAAGAALATWMCVAAALF